MNRFVSEPLLTRFVRDLFTLYAAPDGALSRRDRRRVRILRRSVTAQIYLPLLRLVLRQTAVWSGRRSPMWRLIHRFREGLALESTRRRALPQDAMAVLFGPLDVALELAASRETRPVAALPSVAARTACGA